MPCSSGPLPQVPKTKIAMIAILPINVTTDFLFTLHYLLVVEANTDLGRPSVFGEIKGSFSTYSFPDMRLDSACRYRHHY